jgi:hypothetical protein
VGVEGLEDVLARLLLEDRARVLKSQLLYAK